VAFWRCSVNLRMRRCVAAASTYENHQFITRSGSNLKFWVFSVQVRPANVGVFNHYMPDWT
jgi:hypothetical protein